MCLDHGAAMGVSIHPGWMASLWGLTVITLFSIGLEALGKGDMGSKSSKIGFYTLSWRALSV